MPPPAPTPCGREAPEEPGRLARVIARGWRLIGLSTLLSLAAAGIYLAVARRVYGAEAQLLIMQQGGRPLNVSNADPNRILEEAPDYIPTHTLILKSPLVVKRSIDRVGLDRLPSLQAAKRAGRDPVKEAIDQLRVTRPDRMANILRVEYRSGDRDEVARMVVAITDSYRQLLDETFKQSSNSVIALISKASDELGRELRDLEREYLELRRHASTPLTGVEGRSVMASGLARWYQAADEAMLKAVQLKEQLALGRELARGGIELWVLAHAIGQLGGDHNSLTAILGPSQDGAADYIRQLTQEHQQLSERFGPDYTKVRELQAQIERIRQQEAHGAARSRLEKSEVPDLLNAIEQSLRSVQATHDEIGKQIEQRQHRAKQAELDLLAEDDLRNKIERHRALFHSVVQQLKQAQFVSDYTGFTSLVISPALTPQGRAWPRASLLLGLALLVGPLLGTGTVVALDRLDRRIRSLDDLRQVTGLAVLGQVATIPESQAAVLGPAGLISHTLPGSTWAETYRAARTQIDLLRRNGHLQVLLVTSVHPGDGKTTTASNLAIIFAIAGRKVLLIDADLRRPSLDKVHGLHGTCGLAQLIQGLGPLSRIVQRSRVENLDILTTGPTVSNPAELLASPRLAGVLDEARRSYDIIVVDTPPLLAVTDPSIVGAAADGIVLAVRASRKLNRHDAERSLELLRSLGTPILGLLVNGTFREDGGYGYGDRVAENTSRPHGVHTSGPSMTPARRLESGPEDPETPGASAEQPDVGLARIDPGSRGVAGDEIGQPSQLFEPGWADPLPCSRLRVAPPLAGRATTSGDEEATVDGSSILPGTDGSADRAMPLAGSSPNRAAPATRRRTADSASGRDGGRTGDADPDGEYAYAASLAYATQPPAPETWRRETCIFPGRFRAPLHCVLKIAALSASTQEGSSCGGTPEGIGGGVDVEAPGATSCAAMAASDGEAPDAVARVAADGPDLEGPIDAPSVAPRESD